MKSSISLLTAIFININIILGTGLFINTAVLAQKAGFYGAFSYLFVGLLLLPIVIVISILLKKYPAGGFYEFGKGSTPPLIRFLSTWSYFFSKPGSAALAVHIFSSMIQEIFSITRIIPLFMLDILLIGLFTYVNTKKMTTGLVFQKLLMLAKGFLVLFILESGIVKFSQLHFETKPFHFPDYISTIPFVLFSLLGFEAICSLNMHMHKGSANA